MEKDDEKEKAYQAALLRIPFVMGVQEAFTFQEGFEEGWTRAHQWKRISVDGLPEAAKRLEMELPEGLFKLACKWEKAYDRESHAYQNSTHADLLAQFAAFVLSLPEYTGEV